MEGCHYIEGCCLGLGVKLSWKLHGLRPFFFNTPLSFVRFAGGILLYTGMLLYRGMLLRIRDEIELAITPPSAVLFCFKHTFRVCSLRLRNVTV